MSDTILFEVPILSSPTSGKTIGTITCTSPSAQVYLLTFVAPPDNRLTTSFCQAFLLALDVVEFSLPSGVVITTSGIPKFYSNGLDLPHARDTVGFWTESLYKVFTRLATYPMPTIALINGHAFAGGLMLAMYHDYRVFNPARGFLCLNELDFGYPLKPAMSSIFRQKVHQPAIYRSLVLEAKRFSAQDALAGGIVDSLGGLEQVLALVKERKLTEKGKSGIYGIMKGEMLRESIALMEGHEREEKRDRDILKAETARKDAGKKRVEEWQRKAKSSKSKL